MADDLGLEGLTEDQRNNLARWSNSLLRNKETREGFLNLTKKANPAFTHPELVVKETINASVEELRKDNKTLAEQLQKQVIETARDKKAAELKAKGFDIEAVEKVMGDNNIASYETAMKFMSQESRLAAATPASLSSTNANMPTDMKDIAKNPAKWAREQAVKVMNEFRIGAAT
jgi:hypothetical protein